MLRLVRRRIDILERWVEVAPRQVLAALDELRRSRPTRSEERKIAALEQHARVRCGTLDAARVLFPVVPLHPVRGILGGLVPVYAHAGAAGIESERFLRDVAPPASATIALARALAEADVSLQLLRTDLGVRAEALDWSGASCVAAHAVAAAAGRCPPSRQLVVSGSLRLLDGRVLLRGVTRLDEKAAVVSREAPDSVALLIGYGPGATLPAPGLRLHDLLEVAGIATSLPRTRIPQTRSELKVCEFEAENAYLEQRYAEALTSFEALTEAVLKGGFNPVLSAELQFRSLLRRSSIAIHEADPPRAALLQSEARAWLDDHPEVPRPLQVDYHLGRVDRLVDQFDLDGATAELGHVSVDLDSAARSYSEDKRRNATRLLGTRRRLALLRGDPEAALDHQLRLRTIAWALVYERPRVLCDLGFVLAQLGRADEALEALDRGLLLLPDVQIESYRAQTEAFLRFFRGRILLARGKRLDDHPRLEELGGEQLNGAPNWRLAQLLALDALAAGDADGDQLVMSLARCRPRPPRVPPGSSEPPTETSFGRIMGVLGLLLGHELRPDLAPRIGKELRALLVGVPAQVAWPPLRNALARLASEGLDAGEAVQFVLSHRSY